MKYSKDIVSIILPVCNASLYLEDALKSLINQTHTQLEIIAIDDASKDNSYKILKEYQKKDARIKVYKNKKRYGIAISFNRALRRAKGAYIAFMNAKDVNSLHRIKRQITFLKNNPKIAGVGTQYTEIDEKNRKYEKSSFPTAHEKIYKFLLSSPTLHYETTMLNRLLLPKDSIRFTKDFYPHLFTDVFMNLFQYARFANLSQHLYFKRKDILPTANKQRQKDYFVSYVQLWIKSIAVYDYRPSLRSLLTTFSSPRSAQ